MLHIVWTVKSSIANRHDRNKSNILLEEISNLIHICWPAEVKKQENEFIKASRSVFHWTHMLFVTVTILLAALVVVLTFLSQ